MEFLISNFKIIATIVTIVIIAALLIKHNAKIKTFLLEVKVELSKVSWSSRQELISATGVVIVITLILAAYIGAVDSFLSVLLNYFIR